MPDITLTAHEMLLASDVGRMRQISSLRRGLADAHGYSGDDGWTAHIEGACGELVVAKLLGLYWDGSVNTFQRGGDVADLQVRTRSKHYYELIVRPNDKDDARFILVTGIAPVYRVRGWILGRDAKRPEWSQTHGGRPAAFFVPHGSLQGFETEVARAA